LLVPKVLILRQSTFYLGLERFLVESATRFNSQYPDWQLDLLHLCTRRGLAANQQAPRLDEHSLLQAATSKGLRAWQWGDAGQVAVGQWHKLGQFVRAQGYDLIHTHDPKTNFLGLLLKRWLSVRVVATAHGYPRALRRNTLYRLLDQWLLPSLDHVITVSEAFRQTLLARGYHPDRTTTVHIGLDVTTFRRQAAGSSATTAGPVILTVARLSAEKGLNYLLESAALIHQQFPVARFLIAGEGPLRPQLEQQARDLRLDTCLTFLGQRTDVAHLMAQSDLVVLPSLEEAGCPLVLIEAQALGKAVVATRVGGIPELISDGLTGVLVPPADHAALAAACARLLADPELASRLGQQGAQAVERDFELGSVISRTEAIYRQVLAGPTSLRA
jgi:glycosyltransferase involved in cell wall biosynthesis